MGDTGAKNPLDEYCKRFGQIAAEKRYVTAEQVKEALSDQVDDDLANRPHRLLGEIFFTRNWMTANQIETVMNEMFGIPR